MRSTGERLAAAAKSGCRRTVTYAVNKSLTIKAGGWAAVSQDEARPSSRAVLAVCMWGAGAFVRFCCRAFVKVSAAWGAA